MSCSPSSSRRYKAMKEKGERLAAWNEARLTEVTFFEPVFMWYLYTVKTYVDEWEHAVVRKDYSADL